MTTSNPEFGGRPVYGYDATVVQNYYTLREAERVAEFFLPYLESGMTLLDCGCGPGTVTLGLAEAVAPAQTVGIDLEPSMVERATSFAAGRRTDNIEFQVADIRDLPFPDDSFDVVFTSAVLEHLGDPDRALREIHRVVKPGGLVGVINTDWGDPLISPLNESVSRFFEISRLYSLRPSTSPFFTCSSK